MDSLSVLRETYKMSSMVLTRYVSDFTDDELMHRPGPGCNSVAWQLGHLIASECSLLNSVASGSAPELPDGFEAHHAKENRESTERGDFLSKDEYLHLFDQLKTSTFKVLDSLTEADLDRPSPEQLQKFFPTLGALLILISTHSLMHAGQFVPVRRALNKPVVI